MLMVMEAGGGPPRRWEARPRCVTAPPAITVESLALETFSSGLLRIGLGRPAPTGGVEIAGEVVQVDRYGNLITNIPGDWLLVGEDDRGGAEAGERPPGSLASPGAQGAPGSRGSPGAAGCLSVWTWAQEYQWSAVRA